MERYPTCNDRKGECFARTERGTCDCLSTTYTIGIKCPFKKEHRRVTNGKYYPYNKKYLA